MRSPVLRAPRSHEVFLESVAVLVSLDPQRALSKTLGCESCTGDCLAVSYNSGDWKHL